MASISFFVPGIPAPGGSKRAFPIFRGKKGAKVFTGRVAMVDAAGERNKNWRQSVVQSAFDAMKKAELAPFVVPLRASFIFWMPRPANHHKGADRQRELKDGAAHWHASKPDLLKLARSTEDAMTGIVYADDKLIVKYDVLEKLYVFAGPDFTPGQRSDCTLAGASITICELDGEVPQG